MADLGNVSKLKLPNGNVVHVKDNVSGYVTTVAWDSSNSKLTKTANGVTTDVVTIETIKNALALPDPMVFKGSLGTGGTITTLPTAAASNKGYTYKVITAGTYAGQEAKVGDTFVSDGSSWVLIPSGDEPSGTVTSVAVNNGTNGGLTVSGSPITSSGTITIGHSNVLSNAQNTRALYPIKIDKNGHISEYGSAISVPTSAVNNTTGITIGNHSTTTICGVQSGTTTASKASGANGTAPSLTYGIDGTDEHQLNISWSEGSVSTWSFNNVVVPIKDESVTTVVTNGAHSITDNGHTHTLS